MLWRNFYVCGGTQTVEVLSWPFSKTTLRWISVKIQKELSKANRRKDKVICLPGGGREILK